MLYEKIVTPKLSGNLNFSTTSATFDIAFQQSGTLSLYKMGNATPIATTTISQVDLSPTFKPKNAIAGDLYFFITVEMKRNSRTQPVG